ncbi:MAG: aspartate aminotransferase family protein, partial [Oleiphilus sp.]
PFNDIDALKNIARSNPNVVAVMLEPIQGEAGVQLASSAYFKELRALCNEQDWLLMADEVQTGNGRTGEYFASQTFDIDPDVITTAKGLGNGFPIGACMAKNKAAEILGPGSHGSTFGGNALACAAALATLEQIEKQQLCQRAQTLGSRIIDGLENQLGSADYVKEIRGCGLMIGIEMHDPCLALVPLAKAKGLLLNVTSENVIRLLPALNMSDEECEFLIDAVVQIIRLYAADDRNQPRA